MELNELLTLNKFSGYSNYFPGLGNTHIKGVPIASSVTLPTLNIPEQLPYKNVRKPSGDFNWSGVGNAIGATAAFVGDVYNGTRYENSAQDLLQNANRSNSSTNDVGYEMQNSIDADREMQIEHRQNVSNTLKSMGSGAAMGAAVGSIFPGAGTVIGGAIGSALGLAGGLFGSGKRHAAARRAIAEANNQRMRTNNYNRDVAMTTGMQADFANEYGNTEDQVLYTKHGKDMGSKGRTIGLGTVETSNGPKYGFQNAWVSEGEGIYNPSTGYARFVTHGQNDTAKANLKAEDVVFGDLKNPETGRTFKKDAAQYILAKENLNKKRPKTTDERTLRIFEATSKPLADALDAKLQDLAQIQEQTRAYDDYTGIMKAKHGKDALPKMKLGGGVSNAIAGILGTGLSIGQYFDAKNQRIYRPYTYVENPYERRALADMYGLRINPYNTLQQLRSIAGRANYATNVSGGLSTGQKMLQKTAIASNTQANTANALQNIAEKNIALRSATDTAALNAGEQSASNMMNALRWDSDQYAKAHAARIAGMQTAESNFLAQIQQYLANAWKYRTGIATIDMWNKDLALRAKGK